MARQSIDGVVAEDPRDDAVDEPREVARNVLHGTIASLALEGERARVRIDTAPPLVADVTPGSVARLGLAEGVEVWASFKAVEVRLVLPS